MHCSIHTLSSQVVWLVVSCNNTAGWRESGRKTGFYYLSTVICFVCYYNHLQITVAEM